MSEQVLQDGSVNPLVCVVETFVAPDKAFNAVKQRSSTWWVPFLIAVVLGGIYSFTVLHKIGLPALVDGTIRQSASLSERLASLPPDQAAKVRSSIATNFKVGMYATPVLSLVIGLAVAGILLATVNFGLGGKATFRQMLAVWFYGTLPLTLFYLLVVVAVFAGVGGDSFSMQNPLGTNIGYYLEGSETAKWLIALLSSIDLFAIWTALLLTIGVARVAEVKRGAAAAVVCGWWLVFILFKVVGASFGG